MAAAAAPGGYISETFPIKVHLVFYKKSDRSLASIPEDRPRFGSNMTKIMKKSVQVMMDLFNETLVKGRVPISPFLFESIEPIQEEFGDSTMTGKYALTIQIRPRNQSEKFKFINGFYSFLALHLSIAISETVSVNTKYNVEPEFIADRVVSRRFTDALKNIRAENSDPPMNNAYSGNASSAAAASAAGGSAEASIAEADPTGNYGAEANDPTEQTGGSRRSRRYRRRRRTIRRKHKNKE